MVKATEVFLSLRKPGAGKVLFEMENKAEIRQLMNERLNAASQSTSASKKANPGAEYQNALTELWDKADQDSFNERAHIKDIFEWVYVWYIRDFTNFDLGHSGIKIISS